MVLGVRSRPVVRETKSKRRTWYISSNGNDSNSGKSPSSPLQSSNGFYNKIYGQLRGGDRILFNGTISDRFYIANDAIVSKPRIPVVFGSYGGSRATIQCNDNNSPVINAFECSVAVENLNIRGTGLAVSTAAAISFYTENVPEIPNCRVVNCDIRNAYSGIWFGSGNEAKISNLLISSCYLSDHLEDGIFSYSAGVAANLHSGQVRYCQVFNIRGDTTTTDPAGDSIKLGACKNFVIENCYADGIGGTQANRANAMWFFRSTNCVIRNNIVVNYRRIVGLDGSAFGLDEDCYDCEMSNNFAYNCDGTGLLFQRGGNNKAYGNIVVDCAKAGDHGGILLAGGTNGEAATGLQVYNNTVVTNPDAFTSGFPCVLKISHGNITGNVFNNIFISGGNRIEMLVAAADSPVNFYGNAYQAIGLFRIFWNGSTYASIKGLRTLGKEVYNAAPVGVQINSTQQLLVNSDGVSATDFKLINPNALASRGLALSNFNATFAKDLFGNTVTQSASNIGADQSVVTYTAPSPLPFSNSLDFSDSRNSGYLGVI